MSNIVVSYDLFKPEQNYHAVIEKIKSLGGWAKIHKSVWYLQTNLTAQQVRNAVRFVMDANDSVFVVDASNNQAAWHNLEADVAAYLQRQWTSSGLLAA